MCVLCRCVHPDGHVQMAVEEKLVILADEVYQANVWKAGASFCSFKKVIENFSKTYTYHDRKTLCLIR